MRKAIDTMQKTNQIQLSLSDYESRMTQYNQLLSNLRTAYFLARKEIIKEKAALTRRYINESAKYHVGDKLHYYPIDDTGYTKPLEVVVVSRTMSQDHSIKYRVCKCKKDGSKGKCIIPWMIDERDLHIKLIDNYG